eukprot:TRINITY_DN7340_c0_g1_i1.p1 TRINITY_DN7340_c0_g1~~TRINITY_DN7340_c0_g1_i1.p1  ORF type:complete len:245 (+),score=59.40 TRINITY_DN7340_c0_g1_i1:89-823(+)
MSSQSRSARCVFVGNIPYDATEEQLIEIFQTVGPVVSFRLVFDRETGKPKGYGFCEFRDAETALSAMRNLNDQEFNGRTLRVDFAETEKQNMKAAEAAANSANRAAARNNIPNQSAAPSNQDTVSAYVEGTPKPQLYEMVAKMKALAQQNQEQARQLLLSNPHFAYGLLQAQFMLGMISSQTVQQVLAAKMGLGMNVGYPGMMQPGFNPNAQFGAMKPGMAAPAMGMFPAQPQPAPQYLSLIHI